MHSPEIPPLSWLGAVSLHCYERGVMLIVPVAASSAKQTTGSPS